MIDAKRLDELEDAMQCGACIDPDVTEELIRLARLGLWAREKGIPALRHVDDAMKHYWAISVDNRVRQEVKAAFVALPAQEMKE